MIHGQVSVPRPGGADVPRINNQIPYRNSSEDEGIPGVVHLRDICCKRKRGLREGADRHLVGCSIHLASTAEGDPPNEGGTSVAISIVTDDPFVMRALVPGRFYSLTLRTYPGDMVLREVIL